VGLWGYIYVLEGVHLERAVAGAVVSGYWIAMVVGRVVLGSIAERLGTWTMLTSASVALLGATALTSAQSQILGAGAILLIGFSTAPSPFLRFSASRWPTTQGHSLHACSSW
jgi:fucose permease